MLPSDSGILLVDANSILLHHWLALWIGHQSIKISDGPETIAPQRQIIGGETSADISKVEGLLPVVWRAGIRIRDGHLAQADSVEYGTAFIANVSQKEALAVVETHSHAPFLPLKHVIRVDGEGCALGLRDLQWTQTVADLQSFWYVLVPLSKLPRFGVFVRCMCRAGCDIVDLRNNSFGHVHDGREGEWSSIVIAIWVFGFSHKHIDLVLAAFASRHAIGAKVPGFWDDLKMGREFQFFDFGHHSWIFHGYLLDLDDLYEIDIAMVLGAHGVGPLYGIVRQIHVRRNEAVL